MVYAQSQFNQLTINDLEKAKFCLDAGGNVAVRRVQGISARGNPVETWADLPLTWTIDWEAIVVWNDPLLWSTIAIRNGSIRVDSNPNAGGDLTGDSVISVSGGTGAVLWTGTSLSIDLAGLQAMIEAFSTLDLSAVDVTLGMISGDITFDIGTTIDRTNTTNTGEQNFDSDYIANYTDSTLNYSGVTQNFTDNSVSNYDASTTQNFLWTTNITNAIITTLTMAPGSGVLPSNLLATNSPTDWYVASKAVWQDKFTWILGGSGGWWGTGGINAYIDEFTATPWQTVFTLTHDAFSAELVRVSTRSGLYGKQWATNDYTVTALNEITFNDPLTSGDIVTVQYISSLTELLTPTIIPANWTGIYAGILTQPRQIFKNGLYQLITVDRTYVGTDIIFTIPTTITDTIAFIY